MATRVSAETITEITSSPGFIPPGKVSTPPSVDDLKTSIRSEISSRIQFFTQKLSAAGSEEDHLRAQESLQKAQNDRQVFETALKEVPEGFKLVPVLYSKITQEQNAAIHHEYIANVRSRFLQFVGENYADAARALGVCETGIERMKQGLDPADKEGRPYEMNIDHIIERAGSGLWANGKAKDPDQKSEVEDKFRQNHFGNLIFIPEKIHNYKNMLNGLQRIGNLQPGESKWILMMVPERNELNAGFICPPQTPGSRWDVLAVRPKDPFRDVNHADFVIKQTNERIREFRSNPMVEKVLQTIEEVAGRYKQRPADMADDMVKGRRSLSKIFNDVLEHDEAARETEKLLRPVLKEAAASLLKAFDSTVDNLGTPVKGPKLLASFAGFYRGGAMKTLCDQAARLPLPEAKAITDLCKAIDADLDTLMPAKPKQPKPSAEIIYIDKTAAAQKAEFNRQAAKKAKNTQGAPKPSSSRHGKQKRQKGNSDNRQQRYWR